MIQRLRSPTVYASEVKQSCGMPGNGEFGDYLGGILIVNSFKNLANSIDMKVIASSPEEAKRCADSLVTMIVAQQRSLIEERLSGRQELMREMQQVLKREQLFSLKIKNLQIGNFEHFAKLNRINTLLMRIDALHEEILMSEKFPTKLLSPMYVSSKPVSPRINVVIIFGMALSLLLGVLYAMGREGWSKAT